MIADAALAERLGPLVRMILLFRLTAVSVATVYLPSHLGSKATLGPALLLAAGACYFPLRLWNRLGARIAAHPSLLALDTMLVVGILIAAGPDTPFFYVSVGTALLGGVLYGPRGAIGATIGLLAGYAGVMAVKLPHHHDLSSFHWLVDVPVLYPLAAAGGAAIRALIARQLETERALVAAERAATAGEERSRVAREMHDSLGKTLQGIALTARALEKRVNRGDASPALERDAGLLSQAAEVAAREARELIGDLRSDVLERPLGEVVSEHVSRWSRETGVATEVRGEEVDLRNPSGRYELFCILKEALRNIERHAGASRVAVTLSRASDVVEMSIADDGVGMPELAALTDARELEPTGHFGLIGMVERAERLGGRFEIRRGEEAGTTIDVRVPTEDHAAPAATDEVMVA